MVKSCSPFSFPNRCPNFYQLAVTCILPNWLTLGFCHAFVMCPVVIVLFVSTPLEITCCVICFIFIYVIYARLIFWVFCEMLGIPIDELLTFFVFHQRISKPSDTHIGLYMASKHVLLQFAQGNLFALSS